MGYAPDATLAAFRGTYNLGVFFRLATAPRPILLSLSTQDIPIVMPNLDQVGTVYHGAGRLISIPEFECLINGGGESVSFALGGLDPLALSFLLDGNPEVLGARATVGIAPMDARWQPAAPVVAVWSGTADFLTQSMPPEPDATRARTQVLTLACVSGDLSQQLGNNLTLTDATQQALHPGDTSCNRVSRYVGTYLVSWPSFT